MNLRRDRNRATEHLPHGPADRASLAQQLSFDSTRIPDTDTTSNGAAHARPIFGVL